MKIWTLIPILWKGMRDQLEIFFFTTKKIIVRFHWMEKKIKRKQ